MTTDQRRGAGHLCFGLLTFVVGAFLHVVIGGEPFAGFGNIVMIAGGLYVVVGLWAIGRSFSATDYDRRT